MMSRIAICTLVLIVIHPLPSRAAETLVIEIDGKSTTIQGLGSEGRDTLSWSFRNGVVQRYSGITLRALLERYGLQRTRLRGPALAEVITVEGKDGHRVAFGLGELDTSLVSHTLFVADSADGAPLAPPDGSIRLIVAGDRGGARSVRSVVAIRVKE